MNHRRAVSVLLAVTAAAMLVTGSFGFTSVSADRGVSVAVVDTENAFVNASACEKSNGQDDRTNPVSVTVTNQFSDDFTVDEITWESGHPSKQASNPDEPIEPGASETFDGTFGDDTVTVVVSGSLDAAVTVPVEGKCDRGNRTESENRDDETEGDDADDGEKDENGETKEADDADDDDDDGDDDNGDDDENDDDDD
ncbi:MAG: hypothetical protein ACOCQV_01855 [Halolamina sp.]